MKVRINNLLRIIRENTIFKRVGIGMLSNLYGQFVTVFIQILSLPIFLSKWTLYQYGLWVAITAIPSYLSISDVGIIISSANKMAALITEGKINEANRVFQTAQLFLVILIMSIGFIAYFIIFFIPLDLISNDDVRGALILLIATVLLSFIAGLADSVFRATQKYALGVVLSVTTRLVEWIGGVVGLILFETFTATASGVLISKFFMVLLVSYISTKNDKFLTWGFKSASINELKVLLVPSFGMMIFLFCNLLSVQGFTLLTMYTLGPISLAIFNTYRTVGRIILQATSIPSYALWPEFTILFASKQFIKLKKLYSFSMYSTGILSVIISFVIYLDMPEILNYWSKDKISFDWALTILIVIYAFFGSIWHIPRSYLQSISNHNSLSLYYLFIVFLSLCIGFILSKSIGLLGILVALIFMELLMSIISINIVKIKFSENGIQ